VTESLSIKSATDDCPARLTDRGGGSRLLSACSLCHWTEKRRDGREETRAGGNTLEKRNGSPSIILLQNGDARKEGRLVGNEHHIWRETFSITL